MIYKKRLINKYWAELISKGIVFFIVWIPIAHLHNCAAIQPPSGGPKDTTSPNLVSSHPESGTVNFTGNTISLTFDEYMDEKTISSAIELFPTLSKKPDVVYNGKSIDIEIQEILKKNQTYILSVNRDLKDEHGVPMASHTQIAFSTGSTIDAGEIKGRVFDDVETSVHLWRLSDQDTASFLERQPDYFIDGDDEGYYHFQYLSPGNYQLMAVKRSVAGMILQPSRMAYGFPWINSIRVDSSSDLSGLNMMVQLQENPIRLTRTVWTDSTWGKAFFSQHISPNVVLPLTIMENGKATHIYDTFEQKADSTSIIIVPKQPLLRERDYQLNLAGIIQGERIIADSGKVRFSIPDQPDTTHLKWTNQLETFLLTPDPDSMMSISLFFSHPIQYQFDSSHVSLMNSDSERVDVKLYSENWNQISITPLLDWEEEAKYQFEMETKGIIPLSGRPMVDSLISFDIKTTLFEPVGRLTGSVRNRNIPHLKTSILSAENPQNVFTKRVNSDAVFDYINVPEGRYRLMFFSDKNQNNRIDAGRADPFQAGEWFTFYPDTIDIRANWDLELERIELKAHP